MDGEYRQKINIELTESEAECLLNLALSLEKDIIGDSGKQDVSEMVTMLLARLVGAFPAMIETENIISFLKQHGLIAENVPNHMALVPRHRVFKQVEQELLAIRSTINAELTRLNIRETFVKNSCIKQVLDEDRKYPTEQVRLAEIWRRVRSDMNYKFIEDRKQKLKSELKKVTTEITELYRSVQANNRDLPLSFAQ